MNQGILKVSTAYTVEQINPLLPAEHRVVAQKPPSNGYFYELLIEGPDMPPLLVSGNPSEVELLMTCHTETLRMSRVITRFTSLLASFPVTKYL